MKTRIWHQSIADLTQLPGYTGMLAEHAERVSGPDTVVDLHGVRPGTYPDSVSPIETLRNPWCRHLLDMQVTENAVRAEREGYDAMAISCFYDPGLEEARSLVDIPITGICEATLLVGSSIGRSFGLIGLEEQNASFLRGLVRHYGFQDRLACTISLDPPITELELDRAFTGLPEFVNRFESSCQQVVGKGADMLVAAEVLLNEVLVHNGVREVHDIPILDAYSILLAYTETLVQLRRVGALEAGRVTQGAQLSESLADHLRGATQAVLSDSQIYRKAPS